MESIMMIKNRMNSIASTRQITQSMRLVSTAKVQRCRTRMLQNRPFLEESTRLLQTFTSQYNEENHPFLTPREVKTSGVVIICGDRGLCGGYNINAARAAFALIKTLKRAKVLTIGAKARDYCRRRKDLELAGSYRGFSETPTFDHAREIANVLLEWYESEKIDEIYVVYTEYLSMLSQEPKVERILPIAQEEAPAGAAYVACEPGRKAFLKRVVPFYLASYLYGAMLESAACEQSARITSMDSAVKTSDEMMESLALRYNQARQGAITQEIIEIVGGAAAVIQE